AGAGFDRTAFSIDCDTRQATCPQGPASSSWNPAAQRGTGRDSLSWPHRDGLKWLHQDEISASL
ncbi:MAG: hypothetical protein QOJ06_2335, partial [Pseudonocardiales bacterium]|nr:hypothetical protein [Pseudonocardiales bacterium]